MLSLIAIGAFAFTLFGGLFALRFKDKLHLILGLSAGLVVGVAFFELIPEAMELAGGSLSPSFISSLAALGFIAYLILDRFVSPHKHDEKDEHENSPAERDRGILGAGSLSLHSFIDGLTVGLAFQVSPAVGAIVAAAVLAHGFSDGINTVNLILKNTDNKKTAFRWLLADAVAPVLGIILSLFISLSERSLGIILALFAGFFLYIGASELVPESHHKHPTFWTTAATILGMAIIFIVVSIAG